MKLTKAHLKSTIRKEINSYLNENQSVKWCAIYNLDRSTGRAKSPENGGKTKTYILTGDMARWSRSKVMKWLTARGKKGPDKLVRGNCSPYEYKRPIPPKPQPAGPRIEPKESLTRLKQVIKEEIDQILKEEGTYYREVQTIFTANTIEGNLE